MTRRGIPIGRYGGVPVTVGPSWIVVVPLVGVALFAGIEPRLGGTWQRTLVASVGTLLLFASVLVHELGHAITARRRGLKVDGVVVFLFGGYSEIDLEHADPATDVAVSAAGPMASTLLAVAVLAVAAFVPAWAGAHRTLALLGLVNVGVAAFNLLPGYPLDGGRIVRAALLGAGYPRRTADVVTARVGIGLGLFAVAAGVWMSMRDEVGAIVAIPVGVLVLIVAAAAHPRRLQRAGDVMRIVTTTAAETDPVAGVGEPGAAAVPVVVAGRVVGFVTPGAAALLVAEAMTTVGPADVVEVGAPADVAVARARSTGRPVAVTDRGRLVGVIDPPLASNEEI